MKYTFTILLFLQFVLATTLHAQNEPSIHFSFNHLALSVKNVDRSAEFYARVLQLPEITNRTQKPGIRWFSLGDGKELHLISTIPGARTD
jgi:catechol-2,3-dioxygenase